MIFEGVKIRLVIVGLLLGVLMAAMDGTIIATAMGGIVRDLGGMDKFVWVTSSYLIATMIVTPIFGKLSDMYGEKNFFYSAYFYFYLVQYFVQWPIQSLN